MISKVVRESSKLEIMQRGIIPAQILNIPLPKQLQKKRIFLTTKPILHQIVKIIRPEIPIYAGITYLRTIAFLLSCSESNPYMQQETENARKANPTIMLKNFKMYVNSDRSFLFFFIRDFDYFCYFGDQTLSSSSLLFTFGDQSLSNPYVESLLASIQISFIYYQSPQLIWFNKKSKKWKKQFENHGSFNFLIDQTCLKGGFDQINNQIIIMLLRTTRYFLKKIKEIPAEPWIVKPEDASVPFSQKDQSHLNIKAHRDIKRQYSRKRTDEALQPVSPIKGPILVENPKIYDKIYRWCSCGMSLKQPFCDASHEGTDFKPYKFTIQEPVKDITLCGCKLTTKRPFCDGQSCQKLKSSESPAQQNAKKN